jgi:molecular chaperone Hsp33
VSIQATDLVREMVKMHGLEGFPAQALGEAVIGALLLGSYVKSGDRVNLNIRGTGRVKQALVDAAPDGTARGYVIARDTATFTPTEGQTNSGPWGDGLLSVLKTQRSEGNKQPYIGTVPLITGHLAKDLSFYWVQSEQVPTAVGLAVNFEGKEITSAGGFLVQAMPGASPARIAIIDHHIYELQSYAKRLAENADPLLLLSQIFQDMAFVVLEETPLHFKCTCSRERVERALLLTGAEELRSMAEDPKGASVRCDFCTTDYNVDQDSLRKMMLAGEGT